MRGYISLAGVVALIVFISCQKHITQPDEQFLKLHFRYGFGNELNTFHQTYTKDLAIDGHITVDFWLSTEEQRQIIQKMEQIDFFNFPDTITAYSRADSAVAIIEPDPGRQFVLVEYEGKRKEVSWYQPLPEGDYHSRLIREFEQFIIDIIRAKPEYQKLPEARGGWI